MERKPFGFAYDGSRYAPQQSHMEVSENGTEWKLAGRTAKVEPHIAELADDKYAVLFSREFSADFLRRRTDKSYKELLDANIRIGIIDTNPETKTEFQLGLFVQEGDKTPVLMKELFGISEYRLTLGLMTEKQKQEAYQPDKEMLEQMQSANDLLPEGSLDFAEYIRIENVLPSVEQMTEMLNAARELFSEEKKQEHPQEME